VFDGPVDTLVGGELAADVLATVREALANVVKHARATRVDVSVLVGDEVEVRVRDDGIGPRGKPVGGHGLANMRARAEAHGGSCELVARDPMGADLRWRVPLT
jgi:signal transduction histidine kinase